MKRRSMIVAGVGLPWLARARAATPGVDAPPEPGPAREVAVPPLHEERLRNGLHVVVAPRRDLPLVSASLLVRAGPESDPPGHAGVAELTASLLTKGAKRRDGTVLSATALAREAEALGGSLDAGSAWQASTLGMTVSTPRLSQALALMADVALRPVLARDELDRLREQTLDGLRVSLSQPGSVASRVARRLHFSRGPYGSVVTPGSLKRIGRDDAVALHRRAFRPDQALLVLAGDLTPDRGLALARRHFGGWSAETPAANAPVAGEADAATLRTLLVEMPGAGQAAVALVAPRVPMGSPERRIAQVTANLLGGGYSSRLNQEIRVRRGLSYGVFADAESHPGAGLLVALAQTKHESAREVLAVMREEVARVASAPAAAEELDARKANLAGGFARRIETNGGLASLVASQWVQRRPLAELQRYVGEIMAVRPEQVRDFARARWPEPAALQGIIVADPASAGFDAAAGDGVRRVAASALDFDGPEGLVGPRSPAQTAPATTSDAASGAAPGAASGAASAAQASLAPSAPFTSR